MLRQALPAVLPTWLVMLLIVNLDNMLKLASTERLGLGLGFGASLPRRRG